MSKTPRLYRSVWHIALLVRSCSSFRCCHVHSSRSFSQPHWFFSVNPKANDKGDSNNAEETSFDAVELPYDIEQLTRSELEELTVAQLKQQLRLRGLNVSGIKNELVDRLLRFSGTYVDELSKNTSKTVTNEQKQEFVDVTEFLDAEDQGASFKSVNLGTQNNEQPQVQESESSEVWGLNARIVDDYEGRELVIDGLSRTVVEFTGSNQTLVQAYVVASRDALRPFLMGSNITRTPAEVRLQEIQKQREQAARRPVHFDDDSGIDEGDETGIYRDILHRDFSDWGPYTLTGAQLSASEVQGVLLLSDVYGAFTDDTRTLAEKVAFECQPCVVMVPDLFRGQPWKGSTDSFDDKGRTYEAWRALHPDLRVCVDIRAAAACLRERYCVSSIVVWGTCYGGGRALEAASGWLPNGTVHDIDGRIGPPPVNPKAAVAWYPTRYNAQALFGKSHKGQNVDSKGNMRKFAVLSIFAGNDVIPGAARDDAVKLKSVLSEDDRVVDHLVKVFPGQDHGFAHNGISYQGQSSSYERFVDEEFGGAGRVAVDDNDAEVARLLSTAFMETYSRVFLPTVGPPIIEDDQAKHWRNDLEMTGIETASERDIRRELDDAISSFVEEPLEGIRIDPTDQDQEEELKRILRSMQDPSADSGPYEISDDDDLATIYAKLTASDENFQLF